MLDGERSARSRYGEWFGLAATALTVLGTAVFLGGMLFVALGVAGLVGYHFAPGSVSPAMAPGWRIVVGIGALAASAMLHKVLRAWCLSMASSNAGTSVRRSPADE